MLSTYCNKFNFINGDVMIRGHHLEKALLKHPISLQLITKAMTSLMNSYIVVQIDLLCFTFLGSTGNDFH